jgi:class 3 adenylate cyclase
VKPIGDGVLATFDRPARAIGCASAIRDALVPLGLQVRAGLHAGEVDVREGDVAGIAVNVAARVIALDEPGAILVSAALPPLLIGSGIEFEPRGDHELKGVPGSMAIYAVA